MAAHAAAHPNAATVGDHAAVTSLAVRRRAQGHAPNLVSTAPAVGGFVYRVDGGNGRYPLAWASRRVR